MKGEIPQLSISRSHGIAISRRISGYFDKATAFFDWYEPELLFAGIAGRKAVYRPRQFHRHLPDIERFVRFVHACFSRSSALTHSRPYVGVALVRIPLASKVDEALDPLNVGLLGPPAVVLAADCRTYLIEQPRFARLRVGKS